MTEAKDRLYINELSKPTLCGNCGAPTVTLFSRNHPEPDTCPACFAYAAGFEPVVAVNGILQ